MIAIDSSYSRSITWRGARYVSNGHILVRRARGPSGCRPFDWESKPNASAWRRDVFGLSGRRFAKDSQLQQCKSTERFEVVFDGAVRIDARYRALVIEEFGPSTRWRYRGPLDSVHAVSDHGEVVAIVMPINGPEAAIWMKERDRRRPPTRRAA